MGSGAVRSLLACKEGNLGEPESVGVGGVFTMMGAGLLLGGGVRGTTLVSIVCSFPVLGLSKFDALVFCSLAVCLSGNIDPILEATLPRLPSVPNPLLFVGTAPTAPLAFRSGLVLGLLALRGVKACFNLPTGEGDLLSDLLVGGRRLLSGSEDDDEVARASNDLGKAVGARGVVGSAWESKR